MKVLHTGSFDVNIGGPAMSVYNTLYGLRKIGVDAEMFMFPLSKNGRLQGTEVPTHYTNLPIVKKIAYSPTYRSDMLKLGDYDIYHAQGVWQMPTYILAYVARSKKRPYLITPRAMLYPQDIAKSNKFFKIMSLKFKLLPDLNRASCMHVTCEDEMIHCRNLGVKIPIAIIPNPILIKPIYKIKDDDIFRLSYLGRLHPRKNVESLIYAFNALKDTIKNAELLIIGAEVDSYEQFLKDEVKRLGLTNVRFTGFVSGAEKDKAIASSSVIAMPSEYENFGNVILEGLSQGIPCLATTGSPWSILNTENCGWCIECNQEAITDAVYKAYTLSPEELKAMGDRGVKLVHKYFSTEAVATKMKTLYEWILGNSEKPDFVYEE